jgi:hypothetical protein
VTAVKAGFAFALGAGLVLFLVWLTLGVLLAISLRL